jgi:hypothetical protein
MTTTEKSGSLFRTSKNACVSVDKVSPEGSCVLPFGPLYERGSRECSGLTMYYLVPDKTPIALRCRIRPLWYPAKIAT